MRAAEHEATAVSREQLFAEADVLWSIVVAGWVKR